MPSLFSEDAKDFFSGTCYEVVVAFED